MNNDLIILFDELKKRKVSVANFSRETSIPADRVYQWQKGRGKPKVEDSVKIQQWLTGEPKKYQSDLGERIKQKRKEQRLSAEDLAVRLSLDKANIYKWEAGSKPSDPEEYIRIMDWLDDKETGKQTVVTTAIDNLSEANLILARSVEKAINLIGSAHSGSSVSPQFLDAIRSLMAEIRSGKKQMTMEEVQKRLDKVLEKHTADT